MDLVELLNAIFTTIDGVVEACAGVPEEAGVHKGAGRGGAGRGGAGRAFFCCARFVFHTRSCFSTRPLASLEQDGQEVFLTRNRPFLPLKCHPSFFSPPSPCSGDGGLRLRHLLRCARAVRARRGPRGAAVRRRAALPRRALHLHGVGAARARAAGPSRRPHRRCAWGGPG